MLLLNLHRRHFTPSQLAMVGARARECYDRQAKERQKVHTGKQSGATPANLPDLPKSDARDAVGKAVGVSGKSIDYATKVLATGTPELVKAVDEGRIAISSAAAGFGVRPLLAGRPDPCDVSRERCPSVNLAGAA